MTRIFKKPKRFSYKRDENIKTMYLHHHHHQQHNSNGIKCYFRQRCCLLSAWSFALFGSKKIPQEAIEVQYCTQAGKLYRQLMSILGRRKKIFSKLTTQNFEEHWSSYSSSIFFLNLKCWNVSADCSLFTVVKVSGIFYCQTYYKICVYPVCLWDSSIGCSKGH